MDRFNLPELYTNAFGQIAGKVFILDPVVRVPEAKGVNQLTVIDSDTDRTSIMGTPIHMPCKLNDTELPNEPMIEIRGAKNIVTTPIDGMDGTFKELFSIGDYRVTIRGIVIQEDGTDNYPDVEVRAIRDLCESKTDLRISNQLTTIFGITNVVIVDYEFGVIEGANGTQPYVINCLSDKDIDIELLSE